MKTGLFIIIVLLSGCFAGIIYGGLNLLIVEPYLDAAINIENQNLFLRFTFHLLPVKRLNEKMHRSPASQPH